MIITEERRVEVSAAREELKSEELRETLKKSVRDCYASFEEKARLAAPSRKQMVQRCTL